MSIPAYQMRNVLNVYVKQLVASLSRPHGEKPAPEGEEERDAGYAENRRQVVIDKVAVDIINKITSFGSENETGDEEEKDEEKLDGEIPGPETKEKTDFVFSYIGEDNIKTTESISIENIDQLLEQVKIG